MNLLSPIIDFFSAFFKIKSLKPGKKKHFEKTIRGFSYNFFGVIFPFILSFLAIICVNKYDKIWTFLDEGAILLFATAFFTNSIFLFGENQSSISKTYDKVLNHFCFWLVWISSALYMLIYTVIILKLQISFNIHFFRVVSLLLFIISVIACYRSISIDSLKTYNEIDVEKESKIGVDKIINNL